MRVPKAENLSSQTFTSEKSEFVWNFDKTQFICGIFKNGSVYLETGEINDDGDYVKSPAWAEVGPKGNLEILGTWIESNPVYKNFSNGKDLYPLIQEVTEYLK